MKNKSIVKKLILLAVIGAVVAGGGYVAYKGYRSLRQDRLVKQARAYLEEGDQKNAILCLKRAVAYNAWDVEAARLMAGVAEVNRSPAALLWRTRVVECEPDSVEDRLALARTALALRDISVATNALEQISAEGKQTAAYHNVAGSLAGTLQQLDLAESHFSEAVRLEPTNAVLQMNLSALHLHHTNDQLRADARTTLIGLSTNAQVRSQVLRELAKDATRFGQTNEALRLSRELVQETNSVFGDRLFRLSLLQGTQNAGFRPALVTFQQDATNNLGSVEQMARWMIGNTTPGEALDWLQTLPPSLQTNQPVPLLIAECQTMDQDWTALQTSLETANWVQLEFLRHAFVARALRGQGLAGAADGEWELALKSANGQKAGMLMLLTLSAQWGWASEAEAILWEVFNRYPEEKWVAQALQRALYLGGRTRSLQSFFSKALQEQPDDLSIKNNLAMTALLLESEELKPQQLALEVYQQAPTKVSFASTYAYALHLQGENTKALQIMQSFTAEQLQDPSIAGYYGLVLKETGNAGKAKPYLDLALTAPVMLPEERKLFERAAQ